MSCDHENTGRQIELVETRINSSGKVEYTNRVYCSDCKKFLKVYTVVGSMTKGKVIKDVRSYDEGR